MRPQDPFIGREILDGQFHVIQRIGTGGMGSVYKATQPAMNRMVAIKILHPKLVNRRDLTSRFRREARAMSQLSHPNTVKVFMYGELEDGSLYIVMELLEGRNLNQAVRRDGPLPVARAIPILIQVCAALQEAHGLGIVHRDLKPENIFLCNQGGLQDFAKVLDFGLAKVTEQQMRPGSLILTQEGMVFGTPEFMSPEQAQGRELDARSDIYSLAVILYEALTGRLPFNAQTPMEYIQKHVLEQPIPLNERVPEANFPSSLQAVIAKALAKKPEDRWQSATEFAAGLHSVLVGTAAEAASAGAMSLLPPTPAPPQVEGQPPAQPVAHPHTNYGTGQLLAVALSFLAMGVVLALLALRWLPR